jgi:hypothetical protein
MTRDMREFNTETHLRWRGRDWARTPCMQSTRVRKEYNCDEKERSPPSRQIRMAVNTKQHTSGGQSNTLNCFSLSVSLSPNVAGAIWTNKNTTRNEAKNRPPIDSNTRTHLRGEEDEGDAGDGRGGGVHEAEPELVADVPSCNRVVGILRFTIRALSTNMRVLRRSSSEGSTDSGSVRCSQVHDTGFTLTRKMLYYGSKIGSSFKQDDNHDHTHTHLSSDDI